jgi:hypothetical protein
MNRMLMPRLPGGATLALYLLLLTALLPASLAAQQVTVRGQVLGPGAQPMPDLRVVLHRVDATGGATVAETTSAADGGYELGAPASDDSEAVYFVAARYGEELYIGDPFRAEEAGRPMLLQVGDPANSASALLAEAEGAPVQRGRPATPTSWLLLIVPLLGIAGVAVWYLVPHQKVSPERALFIRVAEIDERMDTAPQGQRESLLHERAQLIEQLRAG